MTDDQTSSFERQRYWDTVYAARDASARSWYQSEPAVSLELLDALDVAVDDAIIDVGGGESTLVDHLLVRGFSDIAVLDISELALQASIQRVGASQGVVWTAQDLLTWQPERRYDVWHDRAVFHFLAGEQVAVYLAVLDGSLGQVGAVILATFAPDGPEYCSGLPVTRYSAEGLAAVLGDGFDVLECRNERHTTPTGTIQPFTWMAARRKRQS